MPANETLLRDILTVFDKTKEQREQMGSYNRNVILDLYSGKRMADDCERAYADLLTIDEKRPFDIMISGYYGYQNTGDDSLLYAIINNLTEIKPYADITVLSIKPSETAGLYGVRSIHRFNAFKVIRAMKKTKLLISGGGSLMQDVTSTQSLLYYLSVIKAAKKCGMKVMVYASGIGPINNLGNRSLAGRVLDTADLITLREPASLDEVKALGVKKPLAVVTADPAFSLERAEDKTTDAIFAREGLDPDKSYFAVSVRSWKKADSDFYKKIAELCDYINEKYNMTAMFIPMQKSVDLEANSEIARNMKSEYVTIGGFYSVSELLGVISRTKLVIGMRLHILIYAATANVPVFGLSYDPKIDSVLSYLCQHYKESVEDANLDKMKRGIDDIMENYTSVKQCLLRELQRMRELTKRDSEYAIGFIKK